MVKASDIFPIPGGDTTGPVGATNDAIALFSGTSGKVLKDSQKLITDLATAAQGIKADSALQTSDTGTTAGKIPVLDGTGKLLASTLPESVTGGLSYQGNWNAATNNPAIPAAASGNKGWFYIVTTAGSTAIDGNSTWHIGDWIISNGTSWARIESTDQVNSVAGLQGTITSENLKTALAIVLADVGGFSANGRSLVSAADYSAMRSLLGVVPGTSAGNIPVLDGNGKIAVNQLPDAVVGGLMFQSDWDASANSPTIPTAMSSNKGWYYIVATAGTTPINGVSDWQVGDWIVSTGTKWVKIDSTDQVNSVAGLQGTITAPNLKTALAYTLSEISGLSTNGRSLVAATDYAAMRSLLSLVPGTSAGNIPVLDGSGKLTTTVLPEVVLGTLSYKGSWNAATNTPTIPTASSNNKGWYYVVSVMGSTPIDGTSDWQIGDWIVSNGTTWDKVDSSDQVTSVAGLQGAISTANLKTALAYSTADITGFSTNGRSLVNAADYAAMRNLLGIVLGTAAGNVPVLDGSGKISSTLLPPFVSSVALSAPTGFNISGSPVTDTGTLGFTFASGYEGFTTALKGVINTALQPGAQIPWNDVTGKPNFGAIYAPISHTHTVSQLSDASAAGRSLIQAASYAAMNTLLGVVPGASAGNVPVLDGSGKLSTSLLPESVLGTLSYQGAWNASTNSPAIPSAATANKGWYYVVSVAGTTTISGISDWQVGDWIVSNGTSWDKVDSSDQVNSVAGLQGTITATNLKTALAYTTSDISGFSTNGRSLVNAANYSAMRTLLGLVPGTAQGQIPLLDSSGKVPSALLPSSVGSVALSAPTGFTISGSPVTSTGTLGFVFAAGYEGFTTALKTTINSALQPGAQIPWTDVTGKPNFAAMYAPISHTHTAADISDASADGRALIKATDYAAMRSQLSLVKGTGAGNIPVLDGAGKLDTAVLPDSILGGMTFKGNWDASANSPAIPSATTANKGWYYIVTTAGTSSIGGVNDWQIGDWIVSTGSTWVKVDSSDQVNSVAGLQGTISATDLKTALALEVSDINNLQAQLNSRNLPTRLTSFSQPVSNWNDAQGAGWYCSNPGATNSPDDPDAVHYLGLISSSFFAGALRAGQNVIAYLDGGATKQYERFYDGSSWGSWVEAGSGGGSSGTPLLAGNNLSDLTDVPQAKLNLNLKSMADQAANNVAITGGTITGVSFDGGTF